MSWKSWNSLKLFQLNVIKHWRVKKLHTKKCVFLIVLGISEQWNSNSAAFHENNLKIWNTNGNISKAKFRNRVRGIYRFDIFSWCQKTGFLNSNQKPTEKIETVQGFTKVWVYISARSLFLKWGDTLFSRF